MKRRTFARWMRNAAGLFLLDPEELLAPRRRYWPGADFARPDPFFFSPRDATITHFAIYNAADGEILRRFPVVVGDVRNGETIILPADGQAMMIEAYRAGRAGGRLYAGETEIGSVDFGKHFAPGDMLTVTDVSFRLKP